MLDNCQELFLNFLMVTPSPKHAILVVGGPNRFTLRVHQLTGCTRYR